MILVLTTLVLLFNFNHQLPAVSVTYHVRELLHVKQNQNLRQAEQSQQVEQAEVLRMPISSENCAHGPAGARHQVEDKSASKVVGHDFENVSHRLTGFSRVSVLKKEVLNQVDDKKYFHDCVESLGGSLFWFTKASKETCKESGEDGEYNDAGHE